MSTQTSVTVSKKSFGVRYMEEQRAVLMELVDKAAREAKDNVDRVAQERKAWDILGAVDLYDKKVRLERELEEVESKMAPFNGNKCTRDHYYYENRDGSPLEKARHEAKKLLYPEIDALYRLKDEVKIKVTMACATDEFKDVYEWLVKELTKYNK